MLAENLDALIVYSRGQISEYGDAEFLTGYSPVVRASYAVVTRSGRGPVLVVPTPADRWYVGQMPDPRRCDSPARATSSPDATTRPARPRRSSSRRAPSGVASASRSAQPAPGGRVRGAAPGAAAGRARRRGLPHDAPEAPQGGRGHRRDPPDGGDRRRRLHRRAPRAAPGRDRGRGRRRDPRGGLRPRHARRADLRQRAAVLPRDDRPAVPRRRPGHLYVEIVGPTGYWVELARLVALGRLGPGAARSRRPPRSRARRGGAARGRAHGRRRRPGDRRRAARGGLQSASGTVTASASTTTRP